MTVPRAPAHGLSLGVCCHDCFDSGEVDAAGFEGARPRGLFRPMILCPECSNKRCPKATNHTYSCTGSNEPGQADSVYGGRKDGG